MQLPLQDQQSSNPIVVLDTWSHSRLSTYEKCQREFYFKYIEKRPYPPNHPMTYGKIFHLAIEKVVGEGYSPDEALLFAAAEYGGLPEGERASFLSHILWYSYNRLPDMPHASISSEMKLEVQTTKGTLIGFVDTVIDDPASDMTEIWDYKTGWVSYAATTSRQLALYAWMYREMRFGIVGGTYKGRLIFPRVKEETEVIFTEEKMLEAKNWAISLIDQINDKDQSDMECWSMTKDRTSCDNCPYIALCAAGFVEGLPNDGNPKDMDEAEQIGAFILAQEALIKKMKAGLKKFVKTEGEVPVGNGTWKIESSEPNPKIENLKAVIDYGEKYGLDLQKVLSGNAKELKEWVKGDESKELNPFISWTKPRESFKYDK